MSLMVWDASYVIGESEEVPAIHQEEFKKILNEAINDIK